MAYDKDWAGKFANTAQKSGNFRFIPVSGVSKSGVRAIPVGWL